MVATTRVIALAAASLAMACGLHDTADRSVRADQSVFQGTWRRCLVLVGPAFPNGYYDMEAITIAGDSFTHAHGSGKDSSCAVSQPIDAGTIVFGSEVSLADSSLKAVQCDWHYDAKPAVYDICRVGTTANGPALYRGWIGGSTPAERPTTLSPAYLTKQ